MSLINRNEVRRLEKAAREKDKKYLVEWADKLELQIRQELERALKYKFEFELSSSIDVILIAVTYAAYFSEENRIDENNLAEFMDDLFVTIDMFRTGEYKPEDYIENLKEHGVYFEEMKKYDCSKVYKDYIGSMNEGLVRYIKHRPRKTITLCGDIEFRDAILDKYKEFIYTGNMVFMNPIFDNTMEFDDLEHMIEIEQDKILMSDMLYVVNKDKKTNELTKRLIDFATKNGIEIKYMEQDKEDDKDG